MFMPQVYGSWQEIQWEKYEQIMKTLGRNFFAAMVAKRTLDIGSGSSYFERFLVSNEIDVKNVVSLDIREDYMKRVERENLVVGDGNALPFKDERFDVVLSIDTMHLVKGDDYRRVLKPGGLVFFAVFFTEGVYEERKSLLKNMLAGTDILFEFEVHGQEKEYVIVARKKA
ncbi:MAG: class I SAM-dependent methyltransferase [Candidatus Aenigmarchaeota archaeon]|nr:class I SAM-dependent methyltransferase [Candidatus Aenigmarchaeota archaeon]